MKRHETALPARMAAYVRDHGKYGREIPAATVRLGRDRVKLLEEYGVIDP